MYNVYCTLLNIQINWKQFILIKGLYISQGFHRLNIQLSDILWLYNVYITQVLITYLFMGLYPSLIISGTPV